MASFKPSSLAARRDAPPLPFLKTSFDDTLLQVNSPRLPSASQSTPDLRPSLRRGSSIRSKAEAPTKSPSLKKPHARSTFFGLRNRSKIECATIENNSGLSTPTQQQHPRNFSRPSISTHNSICGQPRQAALSRQPSCELRKFNHSDQDPSATPRAPTRNRQLGVADAVREVEPPTRSTPPVSPNSANWSPPPLFQAFPQAILHKELEDPDHHTLRLSRPKRKGQDHSRVLDGPIAKLKTSKHASRRPSIQSSSTTNTGQKEDHEQAAARKVYVLATSGYLLQYSGEGPADRYPEKMLKIGSKSVAFASDAIPGKHWVIQVLQSASDDELNPFANEKSLLSRLLPVSKAKKRATRSMLLVVDSPSDMNNWLVSLRHEVLKFNRAAHPTSSSRRTAIEPVAKQQEQVSHRVLTIQRSRRSSNLSKPTSPLRSMASGPSVPTSPTFVDSGYISCGTTLAGDKSSSRSSRQPAHTTGTLMSLRPPHTSVDSSGIAESTRANSSYHKDDMPQQPPNTAVPPLTPSAASLNTQLANSPDSKHPSPEQRRDSPRSAHSRKASPDQSFYTPATTPMQPFFSQSKAVSSSHNPSSSPTTPRGTPSSVALYQETVDEPALGYALNTTPVLKPSKSATGLYTFNEEDESASPRSVYFSKRSANASTDSFLKKSPPAGNAFAQRNPMYQQQSPTTRSHSSLPKRNSWLQPLQSLSASDTPRSEKPNKRTSFRSNKTLPLQTTSSATTTASSSARASLKLQASGVSILGHASRPVSPASDRNPALLRFGRPPSPSMGPVNSTTSSTLTTPLTNLSAHSPTIPPPLDRSLRRPPNMQVKSDMAPFLSRSGGGSAQGSAPAQAGPGPKCRIPAAVSTRGSKSRTSVLVPIVRPPMRAGQRVSGQVRLGGPPSTSPPSAPLPPTPHQGAHGAGALVTSH